MKKLREHVAQYADLDARRALGVFGCAPRIDIVRGPPEIWRYWVAHRRALYFNPSWDEYSFEIHDRIMYDGEHWTYMDGARVRNVWSNRTGKYRYADYRPLPHIQFLFGQHPEFIV